MKNYLILLSFLLAWSVVGAAGVGVPGVCPGCPGLCPGVPGLHPGLCGFNRCAVGDGAYAVDYVGGCVGWFDCCAGGGGAGFRPGKDFALFFAVNDYVHDTGNGAWKDLSGPVRDARELAADLHDLYGFDTAVVVNPTLEEISRKLDAYYDKKIPSDGQLFIFFSGHGNFIDRKGEGFFIPRDGKKSADDPTQSTWFSLLRLRRQINQLPCPHILLAIDACYSGTLDDRVALKDDDFERMGEGATGNDKLISDMLRVPSRLYFTSGGRERTPDPSGFAAQWKAALRNRGGADGLLTLRELEEEYLSGARVQPEPKAGTFEGHEPGGKFVFVYQAYKQPAKDDIARDRAAWNTAKNTNTLDGYQKYTRDFPHGDFFDLAREKIAALDDIAAWNAAKSANTKAAYDDFIRRFPNSDYAEAARAKRDAPPKITEKTDNNNPNADTYTDPLAGTFIKVKGGTFNMGCTSEQSGCDSDEKPVHPVSLSDYYMGQTEVTQAQWRAVMGSDPPELNFKGCDQCPVERVSWNDIQDFLSRLNARSGNARYRLPTEAEWEYAARGGAQSRGTQYAGSNNIDEVAWYTSNADSKTHPVKGKKANELGLYDMTGNVWEWCQDWKGDYPSGSQTNPAGPTSGAGRVIRGGSWLNDPTVCRVAYRSDGTPDFRFYSVGFRLARTF